MKIMRIPFLMLAALMFGSLGLNAQEAVTLKISAITGSATKTNANGEIIPLKAGDTLAKGDSLTVSGLSNVKLALPDGSVIDVKENTSLTLGELSPDGSQIVINLNFGNIEGAIEAIPSESTFEIQTALGTVASSGGEFSLGLGYNPTLGEFTLAATSTEGEISFTPVSADESVSPETQTITPDSEGVEVRVSSADPGFADVLDTVASFLPTTVSPENDLPQVVTPEAEDPDIQVVSPNTVESSTTPTDS